MNFSPRMRGLMLLVIIPAAACYSLLKPGLESAPSLRFAGSRALVAGFALLVLLALRKKPLLPRRALLWWSVPVGLMATTLTFGSMFLSASYLSTGIATVLGNLQLLGVCPLLGLLIGFLFYGETLSGMTIGGVMLILLGLGIPLFANTFRRIMIE